MSRASLQSLHLRLKKALPTQLFYFYRHGFVQKKKKLSNFNSKMQTFAS